jgi:hypothetical protein
MFISAHAASEGERSVRGRVLSDEGPLPGSTVRFKGTSRRDSTDAAGQFELVGKGARITAWKPGYFIAGVPADANPLQIRLRALPRTDNPDYLWIDPEPSSAQPQNCGNCHAVIHNEWAASAHARGSKNRRFRNLYDGTDWNDKPDVGWNLLKENPAGASVCAACHAPTAPITHEGFEDFRKLDGVHARGVHCDYCHKIAEVSVTGDTQLPLRNGERSAQGGRTEPLGLEHGRFGHRLLRPKEGQLLFGPLDDVDRGEDTYNPLYKESRYCASCHEGTILGTKVYTTYSEWLASPARQIGKQCQGCHMEPTGKFDNFAPGRGGIQRDPLTLASHRMPGGEVTMLRSCLRLTIVLSHEQDKLLVNTELVAANVGHRVPTGFIDRQLLLVVEPVSTKAPALISEGPVLPEAAGNLTGRMGKFYARQIVDDNGHIAAFWQPNRELADTRLEPEKPDSASWTFPAGDVTAFRVRLLYRRFYQAVAEAKHWPDNEITIYERTLTVPELGKKATWRSE